MDRNGCPDLADLVVSGPSYVTTSVISLGLCWNTISFCVVFSHNGLNTTAVYDHEVTCCFSHLKRRPVGASVKINWHLGSGIVSPSVLLAKLSHMPTTLWYFFKAIVSATSSRSSHLWYLLLEEQYYYKSTFADKSKLQGAFCTDLYLPVTQVQHDWQCPSALFTPPSRCPLSPPWCSWPPLQITPQLYTSAACQHLPDALTRPSRNEKLSLLASAQQV